MYELCDFYINGKKLTKAQFLNYAKELDAKELGNVIGDIPTFKQVPKAPFVTDTNAWVKLGLKIALREAIKQGVDRIAWTTGEQQNERYDLSKQVDEIVYSYDRIEEGYNIQVLKDGNTMDARTLKEGELEGYIGKDLSQKIINGESTKEYSTGLKSLSGIDLKVGGKGMIGFYGSPQESKLGIVGNIAKSLFKQEPKTTKIDNTERFQLQEEANNIFSIYDTDKLGTYKENGRNVEFNIKELAQQKIIDLNKEYPKSQQHSIDITPELKAEVEKGLPLFQKDKGKPKGAVETLADGKKVIHALTRPDFPTMVHELGHIFESDLTGDEMVTLEKWAGVARGSVPYREKFARAFERYLRDGKAPIKELQSIFDKFKAWMTNIYKTLKGSPIEKKLSPEVKRIFDRLLTTQKQAVGALIAPETTQTTTKGENGPPDDTTQSTEAKEGGKQREKSYLTRLYNSLKASDRLKKDIEEGGLLYSVLSNVQSSQDADAIIAEMGFAKVERYIRDRNNSIAGSTRNIIANRLGFHYDELASQAEAEGDFDAALEYAEKAYDIFNFVDYVSRDGGRFNQIGASAEISGLLTPKRAVARQKRQIREQRDSKLKAAEKEIKRLRKQLQEINEKAIDEVLGSKTYQQGRTATTKMPKVKAKAIADKIRKLKPSSFGLTFADPTGVTAVFEGAVALVAKTVELSGNIAEAINKGLEYIRNSAWYKSLNGGQQAEVDDKFIEGIQNQINEAVPQEGAEKKSPSQRLAERIDRMLKGPKPQKIDPVRQMIDTLFGKVKEQDTKEKVKPEKKSNIEKIREALEDKAQYAEVWEAAKKEVEFNIEANSELSDAQKQEYKARLEGFYNEMIGKPYSETQAEGATREAIRDMGIEIDKMVRQHYTVQDATARSLVDKLVEDLGLNEADAKMIADSVQKAFDKIATQRKRTILLQGLKARAKTAGTPKAAWERLIDLTNLGAFSNAEFAEAYADAMGFPKLTETQAKEMERLAGEIHKWTGFKKFEKIQDYLAYVAKLPGLDIGEVAMGMWYASILSGQRTQFKNILANTANLLAEWFVGMIYNGIRLDGSTVVMLNKGLGAGFGRGITEWRHVMATGYSSIRDNKIEMPNYMEQWRFKGGRFNPANWAKYVSRFMIATDAFFYSGLKEMRAHELAMVEAHKRNQETPQVTQSDYALASEILYKTSQRRAEAEAQADAEGLKGNERKKRIYDIMDGGRPTGMVAESSYFASKGTFNYKPEGVLGILTETISDVTNKLTLRPTIPFTGGRTVSIRIGKLFVPFTRIIVNVANIALEYTPVGAVRAAKGTIGWEALNRNPDKQGFYRKLSGEERAKTAIRAAAGMIATYAFYALSEPGDDGEEPPLRITANGTGNYAKNQLLKDSKDGFHPYSIKIGGRWYSYQYTPLFLALAPIGLIRDNQRYKRDRGDEDIAPEDVIGAMLISTGSALSDMTWLASVSGLLEAFGSGDVGTFTNYLKRTTSSVSKGFVYPKAIEQTKQMIDDYYDNPKRFASGIFGKVVKDMPVVSNYFPIQYNVLGQPVTVDAVQMMDKGTSDPVASFVGRYWKETGGLSSVRQKSMLIYDVEKGKDRIITDVEFMNFIRVSGQEIARRLEEELMVNEAAMSPMEIGRAIKSIESDVRQKTKAEMFGWREWQTSDPKFWQEMINNRAVQIPISPKSLPIGEKKIPLTEEQLAEYNNIAMSKYIESLKDYFSDKREVEDNKAEMYDATTNTTVYDWRVKGLWQMAREAADWAMIEKIQAQQK